MVTREVLQAALGETLEATEFVGLGERYVGKVRDVYRHPERGLYLVATDRISAFDRVLTTLPFKGQILNQLAAFWFRETAHIAPNHVREVPDPAVLLAEPCEPVRAELIVRAFLTGVTDTSIWTQYQRGRRTWDGLTLRDGLAKNEPLEALVLTPTTKAPKGQHDVPMDREELIEKGHITAADFDRCAELAKALFAFGQSVCERAGLILVDTKYEFGKRPDGTIVVIDEMHTPDSSRFWFADSYAERFEAGEEPQSFDKEFVRRYLADRGFKGEGPIPEIADAVRIEATEKYIEAFERITGRTFEPAVGDPVQRIRQSLL